MLTSFLSAELSDPSWLSIHKDEFLVTDGVIKVIEPSTLHEIGVVFSDADNDTLDRDKVVLAKNAAGEHGCE